MLRKLMKYEFKATGRILLPLYGALLIFAVLSRFVMHNTIFTNGSSGLIHLPDSFIAITTLISFFGYGCIMAAIFVVTFFIMIQRFYKNLLGDQGYLMNTLPLEPYKNITNKLLVSVVWTIASCIIALLSIFILFIKWNDLKFFISQIMPALSQLTDEYGSMPYIICFEFFFTAVVSLFKSIIKLYAAISIGHIFNTKKILLSFVSYVGLSIIEGILTFIIGAISIKLFHINTSGDFIEFSPQLAGCFSGFIIYSIILNLIFFAGYFFITNYILKNKLNLE